MHREYTAVVKQDGDWWIGWVEEVPGVNCQERSLEELEESLRETLKEAPDLNRGEALSAAGVDFQEIKIAIRKGASSSSTSGHAIVNSLEKAAGTHGVESRVKQEIGRPSAY